MYGTRPAAESWHNEYASTMTDLGFIVGNSSACAFYHPKWYLAPSVHGDDFTIVGPKSSRDLFVGKLRERYELKEATRLGPAPCDDKEGRILNRIVRWTSKCVEYEADSRQAEKLIEELGLAGAKALSTVALKPFIGSVRADMKSPEENVTHFRALAAGANLFIGRPTRMSIRS